MLKLCSKTYGRGVHVNMKHCLKNIGKHLKRGICRYPQTLAGLLLGILILTAVTAAAGSLIVSERLSFLASLGLGSLTSMLLTVHMYIIINRALDMASEDAIRYSQRNAVFRILFLIIVVIAGLKLPVLHIPGLLLGLLTLKLSAYMQPLLRRLIDGLYTSGTEAPEPPEREGDGYGE